MKSTAIASTGCSNWGGPASGCWASSWPGCSRWWPWCSSGSSAAGSDAPPVVPRHPIPDNVPDSARRAPPVRGQDPVHLTTFRITAGSSELPRCHRSGVGRRARRAPGADRHRQNGGPDGRQPAAPRRRAWWSRMYVEPRSRAVHLAQRAEHPVRHGAGGFGALRIARPGNRVRSSVTLSRRAPS